MANLLDDIKSLDWQISTAGCGVIAEGLQDIRQCLDIILRTSKGTDPFRNQFGSDIYRFIDSPVAVAVPNMVRAIIEAVQVWEKRVQIVSIRSEIIEHNINFFITYRLIDDELIDLLRLQVGGGFIETIGGGTVALILQGIFPEEFTGKRLYIEFIGDGNVVLPASPLGGFGSPAELFEWVQNNWDGFGKWVLLIDRVVLYMLPDLFQTGSITIKAVGIFKYTAPIPGLGASQHYQIIFLPAGQPGLPSPPVFSTIEQIIVWIRINWADYGRWEIESGTPETQGDFDPMDFDQNDFETGAAAGYNLVLYSDSVEFAILDVLIVND